MKVILLIMTAALSACSGMTFNTNIGPFAEGKVITTAVEEYSVAEIAKYDAINLGFVEASYCQERIDEPKPSKRALINDLKVRAHRLGGNGVVVEACGKAASGSCNQHLECRGVAYSVPQRQSRP